MARTQKITLKKIEEAYGGYDVKPLCLKIGTSDNPIEVSVKKTLSLTERCNMIQDIVNMLFIEDADRVTYYRADLKRFAFDYHVVLYLTNIQLPEDAEAIWEFMSQTDIASQVADALPEGFVAGIIRDANEIIEFKKACLVKRSKLDEVLSGLLDLIKTVNQKVEESDGEAIMSYIDANMPDLKDEIQKALQEHADSDAAK